MFILRRNQSTELKTPGRFLEKHVDPGARGGSAERRWNELVMYQEDEIRQLCISSVECMCTQNSRYYEFLLMRICF